MSNCALWESATTDDGDHVHVLPLGDPISHDERDDGDCICGTSIEPVKRPDGSVGWLIVHNSIDGRERYEDDSTVDCD